MIYSCCNENRKTAVLNNPAIGLNGIDYLEVLDQTTSSTLGSPPQQTLLVYCLNALPTPFTLSPGNVLINGGESVTNVMAVWITPASAPPPAPQTTTQEQNYFATLPANVLLSAPIRRAIFPVTRSASSTTRCRRPKIRLKLLRC